MEMSKWYKYQYKMSSFIKIATDNPVEAFKFGIFVIIRAVLIGWKENQVAFAWAYFGLNPNAKVNLGKWFVAYTKARYIAWLENTNLF